MECKQVRQQAESLSPIGREAPHSQGHQGRLLPLLSISAWRSTKVRAKLMANALNSARGGGGGGGGGGYFWRWRQ